MRCLLLVMVVLFAGGCNLFSPYYDEGKGDDLEDIVGDVEAALERGEPDRAYRYAVAGLDKHQHSLALFYLGAVARVQSAHIGFSDFSAMFRSDGDDGGMEPYASPFAAASIAQGDTTFFLDLPAAELVAMADAFHTSFELLVWARGLIQEGNASEGDLANFEADTYLGFGLSGVLTAMFTVLDADNDLSNGFTENPLVRVFGTDEGWGFSGSVNPDVICDQIHVFQDADETLYDHYRLVVGGDLPEDIPVPNRQIRVENWESPKIDDGALTGEIFTSVHDGLVGLRQLYPCGLKGEGR